MGSDAWRVLIVAKNDNKGGPRGSRQGVTPTSAGDLTPSHAEDWKDEEAEAEVKSADAETRAKIKAQSDTRVETESYKEGFFEKAKHVIQHALHIDEPKHMSHTARTLTPEEETRVKEAHKVEDVGADLKGMPVNKVPGKLRKFISK